MLKRIALIIMCLLLLTSCSENVVDPTFSTDGAPSSAPSESASAIPTEPSGSAPQASEPPALPAIHTELTAAGFVPFPGERQYQKGDLFYIYAMDAGAVSTEGTAIELPGFDCVMTVPADWLDRIYIIAQVSTDGEGINYYRVLNKQLTAVNSAIRDSQPDLVAKGIHTSSPADGQGWAIYLFQLYHYDDPKAFYAERSANPNVCYHTEVVAESNQTLITAYIQQKCTNCDYNQAWMERVLAPKDMGEALFEAVDGNWMPTVDEIAAMISIKP